MKRVKFGLSTKITACILTVQIIVMAAMVLFIGNAITNDTRRSTTNSMETVVEERSRIIENYVQEVEQTLTAYSRAGEILAVLKNPTDEAAVTAAQAYTEKFSADVSNLEGFYVSEWNTHVLAHTNAAVVGITTREGRRLRRCRMRCSRRTAYIIQALSSHPPAVSRSYPYTVRFLMKMAVRSAWWAAAYLPQD